MIPDSEEPYVALSKFVRVVRERDESRREHLVTQELLAAVTRQRDAIERIRCSEFLTAAYKLVAERFAAAFPASPEEIHE